MVHNDRTDTYEMKRDPSFEALRGVAILAVVAIHAQGFDVSLGGLYFYYTLFARQILLFTVPVFIFTSGYWIAKSAPKSWESYWLFLRKRFTRVLIPYFVWSFVVIFLEKRELYFASLRLTILDLMTGGILGPYYFIILICQFYLITPIINRLGRQSSGWCLGVSLNVLGLLFVYWGRNLSGWEVPWHYYLVFFSGWIVFFNWELFLVRIDSASRKSR